LINDKKRMTGLGRGKKGMRSLKKARAPLVKSCFTKSGLRRLARRGGVKRMSGLVYDDARLSVK
jgi:histone H4